VGVRTHGGEPELRSAVGRHETRGCCGPRQASTHRSVNSEGCDAITHGGATNHQRRNSGPRGVENGVSAVDWAGGAEVGRSASGTITRLSGRIDRCEHFFCGGEVCHRRCQRWSVVGRGFGRTVGTVTGGLDWRGRFGCGVAVGRLQNDNVIATPGGGPRGSREHDNQHRERQGRAAEQVRSKRERSHSLCLQSQDIIHSVGRNATEMSRSGVTSGVFCRPRVRRLSRPVSTPGRAGYPGG
jgi:hypothetical protein